MTPAHATDVPAYGSITITNQGTGVAAEWTYDPQLWDCGTDIVGPFNAPTSVIVTCVAKTQESPVDFTCPLMVLTVHTQGLAARAGGRAKCTGTLDTGVISGINSAQRNGNLGRAAAVTCTAYTNSVALIPPYTVTCAEPGLPTL